jgi:molybdopterin adenylyltransferase
MKIGRLTISDRASAGTYEDRGGPEIERILRQHLGADVAFVLDLVPDEVDAIRVALCRMVDTEDCELVVTTGGTGITPRDVTPEATRQALDRELPGFGEAMRAQSFARVPTSILSRATAGTRGRALIVNLPGKPSAIAECLAILMPAIREGLAHLQGQDPHAAPRPSKGGSPRTPADLGRSA